MHANVVEAQKRLTLAKEQYGKAVETIDRQYLKPLIAAGDEKTIAEVNKLRKAFVDVAEVATIAAGAALEQPEAAAAPKGKKKQQ